MLDKNSYNVCHDALVVETPCDSWSRNHLMVLELYLETLELFPRPSYCCSTDTRMHMQNHESLLHFPLFLLMFFYMETLMSAICVHAKRAFVLVFKVDKKQILMRWKSMVFACENQAYRWACPSLVLRPFQIVFQTTVDPLQTIRSMLIIKNRA